MSFQRMPNVSTQIVIDEQIKNYNKLENLICISFVDLMWKAIK